ncbi:uncharacterized protein LOC121656285 isoform X2 [Melanotaenia boesemani]|uniref:uncharacterized protein LOC121656285 isoform X2 n=1 Tax=Melanotaenia boesemani TaxID=1250792 RepID=UPI001C046CE4|nr:uncharacterized protein LOC121656285 isoform X2 [Melanotaenia boesemani]
MAARRKEEFLKSQAPFTTNALKIIIQMVDWCNKTPGSKDLVDEMLHSILFLGKINPVSFSPKDIIPDPDMLNALKEKYSRAFDCYLTHLPRRSPFSFVLDMIVLQKKPENENQIKTSLQSLVQTLDPQFLVSTTLCVSKSNRSVSRYGVSMSTTGPNAGQVVIAASCLSFWDDYVAGAVMTYYPERGHEKDKGKKEYFDGTFQLPKDVACQAYNIQSEQPIDPCKSCGNMFGLSTDVKKEWPYGNCAEVESLSNMFTNEEEVKNRSKPTSEKWTPENRQKASESVLDKLNHVLKMVNFRTWKGGFYTAQ